MRLLLYEGAQFVQENFLQSFAASLSYIVGCERKPKQV